MSDEPTPGPPAGPPTELQQLEAALAAGAITPELFATLRSQLRPAAPSAAPATPAAPAANEELPSLLELFNHPPAATSPAVSLPPPVAAPPAVSLPPPAAAGPVAASAEDVAARQRIEAQLAQLRQKPPAPAPSFLPEPRPTPSFLPEPRPTPPTLPEPRPAPSFLPEPRPTPSASPEPHPALAFSPAAAPPAPPVASAASGEEAPASRSRLPLLLLVLAVLGALAYFFTRSSHPDENLTSPRGAATSPAPTEVAAPKATQRTSKSSKKKPKSKRRQAALPPSPSSEEETVETAPATEETVVAASSAPVAAPGEPVPAAPEATDDAATGKVREVMADYYADLFAPPLHASEHFAPQVERLYIQQNLTPATIDAGLNHGFFPDNQHAVYQIEPGTLHVSPPVGDGTRTATFIERVRLYRVSQQRFQRLRTQVRVRFNANYQIVYLRQEKLLANAFE